MWKLRQPLEGATIRPHGRQIPTVCLLGQEAEGGSMTHSHWAFVLPASSGDVGGDC